MFKLGAVVNVSLKDRTEADPVSGMKATRLVQGQFGIMKSGFKVTGIEWDEAATNTGRQMDAVAIKKKGCMKNVPYDLGPMCCLRGMGIGEGAKYSESVVSEAGNNTVFHQKPVKPLFYFLDDACGDLKAITFIDGAKPVDAGMKENAGRRT
ncbi:hypothetical protein AA103587_1746 [Gluconobacter kanchanaburiensis NBRC 103587]|nr:hypothetical protein AA103587_1746 [Gluconobacter kanchanaburiensis NBRC 103587]